jgi:hypothetical protein
MNYNSFIFKTKYSDDSGEGDPFFYKATLDNTRNIYLITTVNYLGDTPNELDVLEVLDNIRSGEWITYSKDSEGHYESD